MNTTLWILQGILAAMFLMAGIMKTTQPIEKLAKSMTWVNDFAPGTVRLIGSLQFLGALGLVLPMLLNILPILTPIAASGLALTMLVAAIYHIGKKEYKAIGMNLILMAPAVVIAVGRFQF